MEGDERVRFCGACRLNVYNLSGMENTDAEALLRSHEGRLCIRYFARPDGKVMTRNCPRGLAAARLKLARAACICAGIMISGFGIAIQRELAKTDEASWADKMAAKGRSVPLLQPVVDALMPREEVGEVALGRVVVGAIPCPPTISPTSKP